MKAAASAEDILERTPVSEKSRGPCTLRQDQPPVNSKNSESSNLYKKMNIYIKTCHCGNTMKLGLDEDQMYATTDIWDLEHDYMGLKRYTCYFPNTNKFRLPISAYCNKCQKLHRISTFSILESA